VWPSYSGYGRHQHHVIFSPSGSLRGDALTRSVCR
jgi:hypothetical protein